MKIALSLNDICKIVMEKYAPGMGHKATLSTPPEGLRDANTEILHVQILPPGATLPVSVTTTVHPPSP